MRVFFYIKWWNSSSIVKKGLKKHGKKIFQSKLLQTPKCLVFLGKIFTSIFSQTNSIRLYLYFFMDSLSSYAISNIFYLQFNFLGIFQSNAYRVLEILRIYSQNVISHKNAAPPVQYLALFREEEEEKKTWKCSTMWKKAVFTIIA